MGLDINVFCLLFRDGTEVTVSLLEMLFSTNLSAGYTIVTPLISPMCCIMVREQVTTDNLLQIEQNHDSNISNGNYWPNQLHKKSTAY